MVPVKSDQSHALTASDWLKKMFLLSGHETKMPASRLCACGAAIEMNGTNGSFSPGIIELHVCAASAEPVVPQQKIDNK